MRLRLKIFQNSSWNLAGYLFLLFAALIALPLTVRGLGADNYARYVVLIAGVTLISTFDLGLPTSLVKLLSDSSLNHADKVRSIRTSILFTLVIGLFAATLAYFLLIIGNHTAIFGLNSSEIKWLAKSVSAYTFVTFLLSVLSSVPQGREDFGVSSIRAFIAGTGNTFIAASVALATGNLTTVIWAQVHSSVFACVLLIVYLIAVYGYKSAIPFWDKTAAKSLLTFGIPNFLGNLAPQLQANIAKVITSSSLSATSLSALGITQSLIFKGTGVYGQIGNAVFPSAVHLHSIGDKPKLKKLIYFLTTLFFILATAAFAVTYYYGKPLLNLWLSDQELARNTYTLLLPYLLFVIVLSLTPIYSLVVAAKGFPGIPSIFAWVEVILEISILVYLLPRLGFISVPYAALCSQLIVTPFFLYQANKKLRA